MERRLVTGTDDDSRAEWIAPVYRQTVIKSYDLKISECKTTTIYLVVSLFCSRKLKKEEDKKQKTTTLHVCLIRLQVVVTTIMYYKLMQVIVKQHYVL